MFTTPGSTISAEFGILWLGIFVGGILGLGLWAARGNLKAGLTVLGSALGGGPILFMKEVQDAKWSYPVGLVLGLMALRILQARQEILDGRTKKLKRIMAWSDIVAIVCITTAAAVWTFR